ncbi:hypothetical protein QTP88_019509 [Uroleucon formosanum]
MSLVSSDQLTVKFTKLVKGTTDNKVRKKEQNECFDVQRTRRPLEIVMVTELQHTLFGGIHRVYSNNGRADFSRKPGLILILSWN